MDLSHRGRIERSPRWQSTGSSWGYSPPRGSYRTWRGFTCTEPQNRRTHWRFVRYSTLCSTQSQSEVFLCKSKDYLSKPLSRSRSSCVCDTSYTLSCPCSRRIEEVFAGLAPCTGLL